MRDAYQELRSMLEEDEKVEAIVFGPASTDWWRDRPKDPPVGRVLTLEEAEPYMRGWEARGGYGIAMVFPFYAWTDRSVLFIAEYDGMTWIAKVPRNPVECEPELIS